MGKKISLLYCVSNYPSKISDFNLNNIKIMKKNLIAKIGFSDHSKDLSVAAAASKAGATIFEKHICLSGVKALDYEFSINQDQITSYKKTIFKPNLNLNLYKKLLGNRYFTRRKTEELSKSLEDQYLLLKKLKR